LTIEPDVTVLFDGYYAIYVDGNLTAIGTDTKRITISSNIMPSAPADWRYIQINSEGHAEIEFCDISYAGNGIYLLDASHNNISNNNIMFNAVGIALFQSSNNTITDNSIPFNYRGVQIQESSYNIISFNKIADSSEFGIFLRDSSNITMTNNNFANDGVYIQGHILQHFNSHTIPDNNIVNGEPLYYYKNSGGINIDNRPAGQVILANCTDIDIKNLEINKTELAIEVAYSTNILIADNNIFSISWYGIDLFSSSSNTVINNHIVNVEHGITIQWLSNNNIINNNVLLNNRFGIGVGHSSFYNIISDNNVSEHRVGIQVGFATIDNASNNIVTGNIVSNSDFCGIYNFQVSGNEITRNKVSNYYKGIFFQSSSDNKIIDNNIIGNGTSYGEYGLHFLESNGNVITGNTISNNNNGSYLEYSSNNIFANNNISNNGKGIFLHQPYVHNNVITGNTISWNDYEGLDLRFSPDNNITGNDISDNLVGINISYFQAQNNMVRANIVSNNSYGISLWAAPYNSIYHNNLVNNTIQAIDTTNNENYWDNGYPSGGNYWSDFDEPGEGAHDDYNGPDQNMPGSDGIVDLGPPAGGKNPYVIDPDSQDTYPLIESYIHYIILKQGWNLISLPLIQQEQDLIKVLGSIDGLYDAVQWYHVKDTIDPWKHHKVGKPFGNGLTKINETMGFWVHVTEPGDTIFVYNGTQPTENQMITLHPGWNLVGYPSKSVYNRTQGLNTVDFGTEVDMVQWYDAGTQTWHEMGPDDYFVYTRGYWIHAISECVWEVPL